MVTICTGALRRSHAKDSLGRWERVNCLREATHLVQVPAYHGCERMCSSCANMSLHEGSALCKVPLWDLDLEALQRVEQQPEPAPLPVLPSIWESLRKWLSRKT